MKVSFEGIGEMVATFAVAEDMEKGCMVKLDEAGCVRPCADGDEFIGMAVNVRQGYAGVQFSGMAQVAYSGAAPVCGWAKLSADGKGGVKADENGHEYLVVATDTTAATAVVRL